MKREGWRDVAGEVIGGEVENGERSEEAQRSRDGTEEAAIGEVEGDDAEVVVAANSVPGGAERIVAVDRE